MTTAGMIMMIVSTASITTLTAYCFWRVLTLPNPKDVEHRATRHRYRDR